MEPGGGRHQPGGVGEADGADERDERDDAESDHDVHGDADDQFPYLQIIGKSVGDGADDIHVRFYKAKVTSLQGSFGDQEFFITECSGVAIDDGTNGIMDIIQHETAADISFS